jgi:hypothetical protein
MNLILRSVTIPIQLEKFMKIYAERETYLVLESTVIYRENG